MPISCCSQDGKIEAEVKLTGILSLGALQPGEVRKYGTVIAPGLYAPVHQHFFVARMDMAVDCKPGETYNQVCYLKSLTIKFSALGFSLFLIYYFLVFCFLWQMRFGQVHGKAHYNSDFQSNTWMFEFMLYCKASYSVETLYPSSKPESLGCEVGRYDPSPALIDCLMSRTTLKNIWRFLFIGMENE